jgi:hypothetical protein
MGRVCGMLCVPFDASRGFANLPRCWNSGITCCRPLPLDLVPGIAGYLVNKYWFQMLMNTVYKLCTSAESNDARLSSPH